MNASPKMVMVWAEDFFCDFCGLHLPTPELGCKTCKTTRSHPGKVQRFVPAPPPLPPSANPPTDSDLISQGFPGAIL